jgi:hypothetical protein
LETICKRQIVTEPTETDAHRVMDQEPLKDLSFIEDCGSGEESAQFFSMILSVSSQENALTALMTLIPEFLNYTVYFVSVSPLITWETFVGTNIPKKSIKIVLAKPVNDEKVQSIKDLVNFELVYSEANGEESLILEPKNLPLIRFSNDNLHKKYSSFSGFEKPEAKISQIRKIQIGFLFSHFMKQLNSEKINKLDDTLWVDFRQKMNEHFSKCNLQDLSSQMLKFIHRSQVNIQKEAELISYVVKSFSSVMKNSILSP